MFQSKNDFPRLDVRLVGRALVTENGTISASPLAVSLSSLGPVMEALVYGNKAAGHRVDRVYCPDMFVGSSVDSVISGSGHKARIDLCGLKASICSIQVPTSCFGDYAGRRVCPRGHPAMDDRAAISYGASSRFLTTTTATTTTTWTTTTTMTTTTTTR